MGAVAGYHLIKDLVGPPLTEIFEAGDHFGNNAENPEIPVRTENLDTTEDLLYVP